MAIQQIKLHLCNLPIVTKERLFQLHREMLTVNGWIGVIGKMGYRQIAHEMILSAELDNRLGETGYRTVRGASVSLTW